MKKMILATSLLVTSVCSADIIKCTFTEPFASSTYSMTQSTLTYTDFEERTTVLSNVSFQIKSAGVFELVKDGKVLQTLKLTHNGSDGMSDAVYPYEVKDNSPVLAHGSGFGACVSNYLKSK